MARVGRQLQDVVDVLTDRHEPGGPELPPLRPIKGGTLHEALMTVGGEEVAFLIPTELGVEEEGAPHPGSPPSNGGDRGMPPARPLTFAAQSTQDVLRSAPEWHASDLMLGRATPGNGNVVVNLASGVSVVLPSALALEPLSAGARAVAATAHLLGLLESATQRAALLIDGIDAVGARTDEALAPVLDPVSWIRSRAARLWLSWRTWQAAQR